MARPKKLGKYKYLNVSIPEELSDKLDSYAESTRLSKTVIAEIALKEFLDKNMVK